MVESIASSGILGQKMDKEGSAPLSCPIPKVQLFPFIPGMARDVCPGVQLSLWWVIQAALQIQLLYINTDTDMEKTKKKTILEYIS